MIKPTCRQTAASYSYYIKDHLGSVRIVASSSGTVQQKNTYYAFGGLMSDQCTSFDVQPYRFQGKELDRTHGLEWNDHGARFADLLTARWMTMDPLCEKFYSMSPYLLCGGNMVNYTDKDGRIFDFVNGSSKEFVNNVSSAFEYLKAKGCGEFIQQIEDSPTIIYLSENTSTSNSFNPNTNTISWSPLYGLMWGDATLSPTTRLNHELDHVVSYLTDAQDFMNNIEVLPDDDPRSDYHTIEDYRVITGSEQMTAKALGEIKEGQTTRDGHYGIPVITISPISNLPLENFPTTTIFGRIKK